MLSQGLDFVDDGDIDDLYFFEIGDGSFGQEIRFRLGLNEPNFFGRGYIFGNYSFADTASCNFFVNTYFDYAAYYYYYQFIKLTIIIANITYRQLLFALH